MTTYDKYHSHEWECSDDETYVKPRVLSPESQAKLDSQFIERLKQLSETGENVPDDCKIESIEIIITDENVLDVHDFETYEFAKTDENVFEDCKNEANILEIETNVVSDDDISESESEQLSYNEFEYSSERDEEKYDYCTSPGCTRRTKRLSPTSTAKLQEPINRCINDLVKAIVSDHNAVAESYSSDLKTEEGDINL
jgi:hypothetical protein